MVSVYVRERPQWWIMDPKFSKWGNVNVSGMRKKYVEVKKLSCWWSVWFIGDFYCKDSLRLPCTLLMLSALAMVESEKYFQSLMIICQVCTCSWVSLANLQFSCNLSTSLGFFNFYLNFHPNFILALANS